ncbi:hypothetical protein M1N93_02185 [Dehalococcoidia bacterium]|nr:hypothetical protein [Dehalococcoidia bacterium]
MNVATAPKERFKINIRKIIAYGYYGMGKVLRSQAGDDGKVIRHVIYYPAVKDVATLADLVNRISWYFPQSPFSQVKVSVVVDPKLLNTNLKSMAPPASQESYIGQGDNIRLTEHGTVNLSQADAIMLWDKKNMFEPRVLRHLAKVNVVDPWFYYVLEAVLSARLYFQTVDSQQKEELSQLSKRNYQALLDTVAGCERGYVFGTGPSLERAWELDYSGSFRVICNSIVKNKALLRHIKPHLLAFVDEAFFFSPCRYSAEFRRMMLETVEEFQCYIMIRDHEVPLLLAHYPELENRIIGMPAPGVWDMSLREIMGMLLRKPTRMPLPTRIPGHEDELNFPTLDKFYVRVAPSVMPGIMVPVASSVCQEIYIIGADGRKPDESYFWTHSSSSQFSDLMQTVFHTHPSFFRDTLYAEHYKEYCKYFEELLHYGESLGKRYYSLAPSYIPALAKRLVPPEKLRNR